MADDATLLEKIINSTDAMIYLKDEEGRFLFVNRRTAEQLKASPEEIVGKFDRDFIPPAEAERFREQDKKVSETGEPVNYRTSVTLAEGLVTVLDHKFPVAVKGHEHAVGGIAFELKEK